MTGVRQCKFDHKGIDTLFLWVNFQGLPEIIRKWGVSGGYLEVEMNGGVFERFVYI